VVVIKGSPHLLKTEKIFLISTACLDPDDVDFPAFALSRHHEQSVGFQKICG
jgi:hypothetical protein